MRTLPSEKVDASTLIKVRELGTSAKPTSFLHRGVYFVENGKAIGWL
jgi:hypothetical protein